MPPFLNLLHCDLHPEGSKLGRIELADFPFPPSGAVDVHKVEGILDEFLPVNLGDSRTMRQPGAQNLDPSMS